jgi:hypothetical protein
VSGAPPQQSGGHFRVLIVALIRRRSARPVEIENLAVFVVAFSRLSFLQARPLTGHRVASLDRREAQSRGQS